MSFRPLDALRWTAVLAVVAFGMFRIAAGANGTKARVEDRILAMFEALEDGDRAELEQGFSERFRDSDSGTRFWELREHLRSLFEGGRRWKVTLAPDGLRTVTVEDDDESSMGGRRRKEPSKRATVEVRALIERLLPDGSTEPWWDLEATVRLSRRAGVWKVFRIEDVNHGDRRPLDSAD